MSWIYKVDVAPLSSKSQKNDVPLPKFENVIVSGAVPLAGFAEAIANAGAVFKINLKNTNVTIS